MGKLNLTFSNDTRKTLENILHCDLNIFCNLKVKDWKMLMYCFGLNRVGLRLAEGVLCPVYFMIEVFLGVWFGSRHS